MSYIGNLRKPVTVATLLRGGWKRVILAGSTFYKYPGWHLAYERNEAIRMYCAGMNKRGRAFKTYKKKV